LTAFKPKNNSQIVRASNHDEQLDPPERRILAYWQWTDNRRHPVIGNVRLRRQWVLERAE
jgi:hypothetical protein